MLELGLAAAPAFVALMRRYCLDYVNCHDQTVTRDLMVENYRLRMGDYLVEGRDTSYFDATAKLMRQFPGLMLTVHEIATTGDRLMMRFSEHGRRASDGALCAWGGIGLYRWNGTQLTANNVEQDYFSRQRQIRSGEPDSVDHPHVAPWDIDAEPADAEAEAAVRAWLDGGMLACTATVLCDDAWQHRCNMEAIEQRHMVINDLFSVGSRVAFHVTQEGISTGDMTDLEAGTPARLHSAGIVHVKAGRVVQGRVIRNRLDMVRTAIKP
jgi:hypothetical protein